MGKRILGLDIGDIRIGIAVSDPLGLTAQAVSTLKREGIEKDIEALGAICREYGAEEIVVGKSLNMDGSTGPQAEKVVAFAETLAHRLQLKLVLWDERLSTAEARKVLIEGGVRRQKRKTVIDQLSAILILQGYLDAQKVGVHALFPQD